MEGCRPRSLCGDECGSQGHAVFPEVSFPCRIEGITIAVPIPASTNVGGDFGSLKSTVSLPVSLACSLRNQTQTESCISFKRFIHKPVSNPNQKRAMLRRVSIQRVFASYSVFSSLSAVPRAPRAGCQPARHLASTLLSAPLLCPDRHRLRKWPVRRRR